MNERPAVGSPVANALMNWSIIGVMIWMIVPLFRSAQASQYTETGGASSNPMEVAVPMQIMSVTPDPARYLPTNTVAPTYTPYPTMTPYLTYTPLHRFMQLTPTVTKVPFEPSQVNWFFSYYNPDLVREDPVKYAANCHPANVLYSPDGLRVLGCKDTTASGLPWSRFRMFYTTDTPEYMGGVAVPYYPGTLNPLYPMFSVLTVTEPAIIAGDYLVIDICPACDDYADSHGGLFLDFDAIGLPEGVNFWTPVFVSFVRYPWE